MSMIVLCLQKITGGTESSIVDRRYIPENYTNDWYDRLVKEMIIKALPDYKEPYDSLFFLQVKSKDGYDISVDTWSITNVLMEECQKEVLWGIKEPVKHYEDTVERPSMEK